MTRCSTIDSESEAGDTHGLPGVYPASTGECSHTDGWDFPASDFAPEGRQERQGCSG